MRSIKLEYHGVIYSKKNSKRIITNSRTGKPQIISNDNAKAQEMAMTWAFREQAVNQGWFFDKNPKEYEGLSYIICVQIYQQDRRRRDLDNQLTAILDGLVAAHALPDDSNKFIRQIEVYNCGVDKEDPRAIIRIDEATE